MNGSLPCSGVTVRLAGNNRAIHIAGRILADLGAIVSVSPGVNFGQIESEWLGCFDQLPRDKPVTLEICPSSRPSGGPCQTRVLVGGVSTTAERARYGLSETELAFVAGVAVAVGSSDSEPSPLPPGCLDTLVGAHVAAAALAARLDDRHHVEVAAADVVATAVWTNASIYRAAGLPWYRAGRRASGSGGCYPYGIFPVADGDVVLIGRTTRDWASLVDAIGQPLWTNEPRYQDLRRMGRDYPEEVDALLGPWLGCRTRAEVMAAAREYGFPAGPLHSVAEVLKLPSLEDWWRQRPEAACLAPGSVFEFLDAGPSTLQRADSARSPATSRPAADERAGLASTVVLDLSWVWSGPAIGAALADLGATVIKVESGQRPDNTRLRPSNRAADDLPSEAQIELSPMFHIVNRGKRSVSLDLTTPEGRSLLAELAAEADVIIENFRPGVAERLGIDQRSVRRANPTCVHLSMPAYPESPEFDGLKAYAPVLSAGAGIESLVRSAEGDVLGSSTFGLADALSGAIGTAAVLGSLLGRQAGHDGGPIVLHQFLAAVFANGWNLASHQLGSVFAERADPDLQAASLDDLPSSPWLSPDLFQAVTHRWAADIVMPRLPWRFGSRALREVSAPGPIMGADTENVLRGILNKSPSEIETLRSSGILR